MASSLPHTRHARVMTDAEAMMMACAALEAARLSHHDDPPPLPARRLPWPELAIIALALVFCVAALAWRALGH